MILTKHVPASPEQEKIGRANIKEKGISIRILPASQVPECFRHEYLGFLAAPGKSFLNLLKKPGGEKS